MNATLGFGDISEDSMVQWGRGATGYPLSSEASTSCNEIRLPGISDNVPDSCSQRYEGQCDDFRI